MAKALAIQPLSRIDQCELDASKSQESPSEPNQTWLVMTNGSCPTILKGQKETLSVVKSGNDAMTHPTDGFLEGTSKVVYMFLPQNRGQNHNGLVFLGSPDLPTGGCSQKLAIETIRRDICLE